MPVSEGVANAIAKQARAERAKAKATDKNKVPYDTSQIKPAPKGEPTRIDRRFFINKEETGVVSTDRGRKVEGVQKNQEVEFPAELKLQYKTYLQDYLHNLSRLNRENPGVLLTPLHAHDKRLLDMLSDVNGSPSAEKIDTFLNEPDGSGWKIANQVLEHQSALRLFALALQASYRPSGSRRDMSEEMSIRVGMDQGVLNRFYHNNVSPPLMRRLLEIGGRPMQELFGRIPIPDEIQIQAPFIGQVNIRPRDIRRWHVFAPAAAAVGGLGAATGALYAGGVGALAGLAGAEAAAAGAVAITNMFRGGVRLDLRHCEAAFNAISQNADETAFVRAMTGLDVGNYQFVGGQLQVAAGREPNLSADMRGMQEQVLGALYSRFEFYRTIGVPENQIDALPEQTIYLQNTGLRPEQTGTWWHKRMGELFAADPNLSIEENLENFMNDRRILMREMINEHLENKQNAAREEKVFASVAEKEAARKKVGDIEGRLYEQQATEIRNARTALNTDRRTMGGGAVVENAESAVPGEQKTLKNYETNIESLRVSEDALRAELRRVGGRYGSTEAVITALENALTPGAAQIVIDGRTITNTGTAFNTLETRKQDSIRDSTNVIVRRTRPPESDESLGHRMEAYLSSIDAQYVTDKARIQENVETIRAEIAEIRRLQQEVNTKQTALNETNQDAAKVRQLNRELDTQYQNLTAWGITDAQLQSETIEQLMERVNAAYATNPLNGWAGEQNRRPDMRMRIQHAIIESRARATNAGALVTPPVEYTNITDPAGLRISDTQLLTLTPVQIRAEMNRLRRRNPGYPANATDAQIVIAKRIAQERFQARNRAYTEHIREVDERLAQMDGAENRIDFGDDLLLLKTAHDVMNRNDKIYDRAQEVGVNPVLMDVTPITAADAQYSRQERDEGLPRSYYALMDMLFDYQHKPDRGASFARLRRILPPNTLAEILSNRLLPPTANINAFLPNLAGDINTELTTSWDMRQAFRDVIVYLRDRADALE